MSRLGIILSSKTQEMSIETIQYNKEQVEHLTDQLIKLQRSYDSSNGNNISSRVELTSAMKSINKALEVSLLQRSILKVNDKVVT